MLAQTLLHAVPTPRMAWEIAHLIPKTLSVEKKSFLLFACREQKVLSFGSTGPYQSMIDKVATRSYGIDILPLDRKDFWQIDLDERPEDIPQLDVDLLLAGEILEHLTNPGRFLRTLAKLYPNTPLVFSVPNAHWSGQKKHLESRIEKVNLDHVAWYSYHTIRQLTGKCGYGIDDWYWYDGEPLYAKGLIFVVSPYGDQKDEHRLQHCEEEADRRVT